MSEILELTQVEMREKGEELEAKVMGWIAEHIKELQTMPREEAHRKIKEIENQFQREVFPNEVRIKA